MKDKERGHHQHSRRPWHRMFLSGIALVVGLASATLWAAETRQRDPQREQALQERVLAAGYAALAEEQADRAIQIFERAVERWPDHLQARFGLGTAYIKQHRYTEAVTLLETVLEEHPREFFVLNNLGWLYATATDPTYRDGAKAVALAQDALLLQGENFHVWSTLAQGHYVAGNFQRSVRAARQALQLAQQQNAPTTRIAEYRRQVQRAQEAAQAFMILD